VTTSIALRLCLPVVLTGALIAVAGAAGAQTAAPLSRAELLAHLQAIPKYQDLSTPYEVRKKAHDRLTELIKQRGVDFQLDMYKFDKELHDAGISSEARFAISQNYRSAAAAPRPPVAERRPAAERPPAVRPPVAASTPQQPPRTAAEPPASAAGPFSRAELLAYLRSIPKSQDSAVPYQTRKEAHDTLTRLIKERGVDWKQPFGKFDKELSDAGISSESSLAIWHGYRAPGAAVAGGGVALSYFTGRWTMGAPGMTTRYDRQGTAVIRTDKMTGARGGFLEIGADGTYVWQHNQSDPPIRGRWRPATEKEMETAPGRGIVLLRGYDRADWLLKPFTSNVPGEHITVVNLAQTYVYFIGSR
jgi:hypothetical protein